MLEEDASRHGDEFEFSGPNGYFKLNNVNAKILYRSANLNDRNTNLNDGFHGTDLFCEIQ